MDPSASILIHFHNQAMIKQNYKISHDCYTVNDSTVGVVKMELDLPL